MTHLASSGDMMAVVAVFSPAGSSCFTLATVGVIGNVLTGTCRVSAVTTLVSAFTCSKCVRAGNFLIILSLPC